MALMNPFQDETYLRVGSFLAELDLLATSKPLSRAPKRISALDILKVGLSIEPRFLAVLPAALLRAPARILNQDDLPHEIREICEHLANGRVAGPSFGGVAYEEFHRWALHPFADKRRKPVPLKKSMKSFRLSPRAADILRRLASKSGRTETETIEELILSASKGLQKA